MTPIDQTDFYDKAAGKHGNCMQAAVASIMDLPLEAVPNFIEGTKSGGEQHRRFLHWFRDSGLYVLMLPGNYVPEVPYLASGPASRGVHHMVVMSGGKLLHDPHPSRDGLTSVDQVFVLVPFAPGKLLAARS